MKLSVPSLHLLTMEAQDGTGVLVRVHRLELTSEWSNVGDACVGDVPCSQKWAPPCSCYGSYRIKVLLKCTQ